MKKYTTLAALLAAGTTFANADVLTTTFSNAAQATATSVVLSVSGLEGVTAKIDSLVLADSSTSSVSLKTSGDAGSDTTFFSPDTNVGSADGWVANITYTFTGKTLEVASVTLDVGIFAAAGGWQPSSTDRDFVFTVAFGGTSKASGNVTVGGNGTKTPNNGAISLTFDTPVVLTDSAVLTVTVDKGTSNQGCFLGLSDIKLNATVVPEPSAFGLLAGLGALALTASRRRRK